MANEEFENDVGHLSRQNMIDLVLNKSPKIQRMQPKYKNKGEDDFSTKDKLANLLEKKVETAIEVQEIAQHEIQV